MESLGVLDSMKQRGTPPDAICCQTVLRVLDRWDHADEAFGLFEEMREKGMGSAPGVFVMCFFRAGRWSIPSCPPLVMCSIFYAVYSTLTPLRS